VASAKLATIIVFLIVISPVGWLKTS